MASISTTAVQPYSGGSTTSSRMVGLSGSTVRTVRYTFTAPADGATGLSFSFKAAVASGASGADTNLRWYVTTNSSSHASATGTSVAYTGTFSNTYNSNLYQYTFTSKQVNSIALKANTTYYLWLFTGSPSNNTAVSINDSTITLTTSGSYLPYTLSIQSENADVSVTSNGSTLSDGATVYSGDVLSIAYSPKSGHKIQAATVNGTSISSGASYTVSGDVTVLVIAKRIGVVRIDTGTGFVACEIWVDTGTGWKQYIPYIDDDGWTICA